MLCDLLAHWSADVWELFARLVRLARDGALLVMLRALWSQAEVDAYREEWAWEVRCG